MLHIQRRMSLRNVRVRGVSGYLWGFDAAGAAVRTPATISLRSGDKKTQARGYAAGRVNPNAIH